ncbi:hypothetical protein PFISCL1PPCAC_8412, partial [Pristionchus fissidentatus]
MRKGSVWRMAEKKIECNPDDIKTAPSSDSDYELSSVDPIINRELSNSCNGTSLLVKDGYKTVKSKTLECQSGEYKYDGGSSKVLEAHCIKKQ